MPVYSMTTKDFLKDVLAGKRQLLKMSEVRFVKIPGYNELKLENLYGKTIARQEDIRVKMVRLEKENLTIDLLKQKVYKMIKRELANMKNFSL